MEEHGLLQNMGIHRIQLVYFALIHLSGPELALKRPRFGADPSQSQWLREMECLPPVGKWHLIGHGRPKELWPQPLKMPDICSQAAMKLGCQGGRLGLDIWT